MSIYAVLFRMTYSLWILNGESHLFFCESGLCEIRVRSVAMRQS